MRHAFATLAAVLSFAATAGGIAVSNGEIQQSLVNRPLTMTRRIDCAPAVRADGGQLLVGSYLMPTLDGGCGVFRAGEDVSSASWYRATRTDRAAPISVFFRNIDGGTVTLSTIFRERGFPSLPVPIASAGTVTGSIPSITPLASTGAAQTNASNTHAAGEVLLSVVATATMTVPPEGQILFVAWE